MPVCLQIRKDYEEAELRVEQLQHNYFNSVLYQV